MADGPPVHDEGWTPPALDPLLALRQEYSAWSATLAELSEQDFARPTRCAAWDVKGLVGHVQRGVLRLVEALASDPAPPATHDAVTWWRAYDGDPDSPDSIEVAEQSVAIAAGYATGQELAEAFEALWRETLATVEAADTSSLVVTFGPVLTLEEFLKTRVLEATVHRLDLEDALGRRGWGTDGAIGIVDDILVDLLGAEPPTELGWDAVDFIETGCGRRELTDAERKRLGPRLAARFPLLG
jgi:uncharacterized protein (TIGR03083 family)